MNDTICTMVNACTNIYYLSKQLLYELLRKWAGISHLTVKVGNLPLVWKYKKIYCVPLSILLSVPLMLFAAMQMLKKACYNTFAQIIYIRALP